MEASDAQVASLRAKLLDSVQQRRAVLGQSTSSIELAQPGEGLGKMCQYLKEYSTTYLNSGS